MDEQRSNVTRIGRECLKEIWEEVKENRRRLDNCVGHHQFGRVRFANGIARDVTCDVCGGSMSVMSALDYRRGFAAAGGNPELVMSERLLMTGRSSG